MKEGMIGYVEKGIRREEREAIVAMQIQCNL